MILDFICRPILRDAVSANYEHKRITSLTRGQPSGECPANGPKLTLGSNAELSRERSFHFNLRFRSPLEGPINLSPGHRDVPTSPSANCKGGKDEPIQRAAAERAGRGAAAGGERCRGGAAAR